MSLNVNPVYKPHEKGCNCMFCLETKIALLNAALDHLISRTTGKNIDDPDIQRIKQGLIKNVREEGL